MPAKKKPASKVAAKPAAKDKSPAVKPIPDGMRSVTPHLICAGAADAIEFYQRAFGAKLVMRLPAPDGKIMHAQLRIGDSMVFLVDENPQWNCLGPKTRGGTSVTIHLFSEDADALARRAVKAGATLKMPVAEMFWGDRYGVIEDPWGHAWSLATHVKDLTPAQIAQNMKAMCG
jgi:PhnB protein